MDNNAAKMFAIHTSLQELPHKYSNSVSSHVKVMFGMPFISVSC